MRRSLLRTVLTCSGIAVAVPLLNWSFNRNVTLHDFAIQYLYSLVYSNCIGLLLFTFVPRVWMSSDGLRIFPRWLARGGMVVMGTTAGCLVANTFLMAMIRGSYDFWGEFFPSWRISLILSAVAVSFIATFETYKSRLQATALQLKSKELENERALGLATQTRLASLESRVHPHFLFNTINSISSLVHDDPQRAEDMLTRMAALLRFSLDSAQPGLVPIDRELTIVNDYLEIEKARFGDRLRYEIIPYEGGSLEAALSRAGVLVPPLSVQTMVENSIKYAVNAHRNGALIRVLVQLGQGDCTVEVQDDGPGFRSLLLLPGHGLDNLQERLSVLFGDRGRLHIRSKPGETSVSFTIPRAGGEGAGGETAHGSHSRVSG